MTEDNEKLTPRIGGEAAGKSEAVSLTEAVYQMKAVREAEPVTQTEALEQVLREMGSPGRYAVCQIFLYFISVSSVCFVALNFVFLCYVPPHQCSRLNNEDEILREYDLENDTSASFVYTQCSIQLITSLDSNSSAHKQVASFSCLNGNDFHGNKHISFVSEWDFVCEKQTGLTEMVQTGLMLGQAAGAVVTTSIADKVGRKLVVVTSQVLLVLVGVGAAFAPNVYVLIAARFCSGFVQQGCGLVAFTLVMETVIPRYRRMVGVTGGVNWNMTVALFSLTAWLMRDMSWRALQLVTALTGLTVLLYPLFLTESPRWLMANKKHDEILAIFKRTCWMNGKDFAKIRELYNTTVRSHAETKSPPHHGQPEERARNYNSLDIFRHKSVLRPTLVICVTWIACSMTYYGLLLASSTLAGDRHLNFFLMGAVDLLSDPIILLCIDRLGRRVLLMLGLAVTCLGLLTASLLMAFGGSSLTMTLTTVFFIIGKLGIGLTFSTIFIYTPELYPTNLRSAGLGLCSSLSRLGGMAAPYSSSLEKYASWGPGALFTGMCILSASLVLLLPETKGKSLPSTIQEMKKWKIERKNKSDDLNASPDGKALLRQNCR